MKTNGLWHRTHRMPKKPTLDQRITWHFEHQKHCQCRDIPTSLLEEMRKRKML